MSEVARWSYQNTATVKPFTGRDDWKGTNTYGEPYEIACTWTAAAEQVRETGGQGGVRGAEFVAKHLIFTEDKRPKYLDLIQLNGHADWEEIRAVTEWDMSSLGEPDSPDFRLATA